MKYTFKVHFLCFLLPLILLLNLFVVGDIILNPVPDDWEYFQGKSPNLPVTINDDYRVTHVVGLNLVLFLFVLVNVFAFLEIKDNPDVERRKGII